MVTKTTSAVQPAGGRHHPVYRCPRCKSARVSIGYPRMECLRCGWSEPLMDFPISWDWHRYYCCEYGLPDPGPCQPSQHPELTAIGQRLENLEQSLTGLTSEDLRQLKMKHIYDEVQDIRRGLQYTQRLMAESVRTTAVPKRKTSKGTPI